MYYIYSLGTQKVSACRPKPDKIRHFLRSIYSRNNFTLQILVILFRLTRPHSTIYLLLALLTFLLFHTSYAVHPTFTETVYTSSVFEDAPLGTTVLQVIATEPNNMVTYSMDIVGEQDFDIDANGDITLQVILDRETQDSYEFQVSVHSKTFFGRNSDLFSLHALAELDSGR